MSESETSDEEDHGKEFEGNEFGIDPCDVIESRWRLLCPPHLETYVEQKWYAVIWLGKRTSLFIEKVLHHFLVFKERIVEQHEMKFLKSKTGSGTKLEDTPVHL